ncbi:N-acetylmuramoyl-L-alanine amidase [uncultured Roseobacter sp.]|uniref:N-acetylmuramoyl-L-alanine amidase n=1 Tax=uncultured Roseobacter sp. TaxID=114847 RepID=UPI002607387C|nr:N-acetylmuramoyl-L-alanine amidase [uncultured Roseobacter sp.]
MIRTFLTGAVLLWAVASPAAAQGIARVDPQASGVVDGWFSAPSVQLYLSQGVPFRVFTLDSPPRLVIDLSEADWTGVTPTDLLPAPGAITAIRFGAHGPGWSRLVAELAEPMAFEAGMTLDQSAGTARLQVDLSAVSATEFAARAGPPDGALWARQTPTEVAPIVDDRFVVVIDPGHGGKDPGAEREGLNEKGLMLQMARALREALLRAGDLEVVLTRDADLFVPLETRAAIAHRAGADLFVSLHADALSAGDAEGAAVYILSDQAQSSASAYLASRQNRDEILAGSDLRKTDDTVTGVLLDLARQETQPRSRTLATSLIRGMAAAGGPMNGHPLRHAGFSVLKSADIPSVLIEVGFLSSARDLTNLRDPTWRAAMVGGIARGILEWRDDDAARRALVRQ